MKLRWFVLMLLTVLFISCSGGGGNNNDDPPGGTQTGPQPRDNGDDTSSSTDSEPANKLIEDLSIIWEQSDLWAAIESTSEFGYHPCNAAMFAEYVVVTTCVDHKIVTLDSGTGDYVAEATLPDTAALFIDADQLVVYEDGIRTYYTGELTQATGEASSAVLFANLFVNDTPYIYTGTDPDLEDFVSQFRFYNHVIFAGEDLRLASYNQEGGDYVEYSRNGNVFKQGNTPGSAILDAVTTEHQASDRAELPVGTAMRVDYLTNETWMAVLDTDPDAFSLPDYYYLYTADGSAVYMGQFVNIIYNYGLYDNAMAVYSISRSEEEPHRFYQFNLADGGTLSEKVISANDLAPVLYRQNHAKGRIVSISDSYSTVVMMQ